MFRTFQPSIAPSVVFKIFDKKHVQTHSVKIAKLWTRLPRNEQETCANCGQCVCNLASHLVIECGSNDLQRELFKLTCRQLLGNTNTRAFLTNHLTDCIAICLVAQMMCLITLNYTNCFFFILINLYLKLQNVLIKIHLK